MAVDLAVAACFKFSRSLFRSEDGSPIVFYSDYHSDELQSIIHKGGGHLINHPVGASILAEYLGLKASTSSCEVSASDAVSRHEETNMVNISGNSRITVKASDLQGRKKYSPSDDLNIIKYLINHDKYSETGGNLVWKQMEARNITEHSHQSMKARFKKQIIPKIDKYNIPADWIEKLCGDYCSDTSEDDMELNRHVKSFDDIDAWKNEEKRLKMCVNSRVPVSGEKDSREPSDDSPAKNSSISSEFSATSSLPDRHSRAISRSNMTTEADSNSLGSAHLVKETCDNIEFVVPLDIQSSNCEPAGAQIDIPEGSSKETIISETQCFHYDEMDCLILAEASKRKGIVDPDKSNKQSNISNESFAERELVKEMINCDECSPRKQINLRSQSFTNKEKNGNIVIGEVDKSPGTSTRYLSPLKEKHMSENRGPASKKQIVSDGHVDVISKECINSLSKIINIIGENSFDSKQTNKLLPPRDSNLKQQNNEPQSKSTGQVKEQISEQNTNTVNNFRKTKSASSKITKKATYSKDSSDMSGEETGSSDEERGSSHNHTKKQSSNAVPAGENSAVNRTSASLKSNNQETEPVEDLSWCSKESTIRKVKYLSVEYGLDIEEAANLLVMHDGKFESVINFLES